MIADGNNSKSNNGLYGANNGGGGSSVSCTTAGGVLGVEALRKTKDRSRVATAVMPNPHLQAGACPPQARRTLPQSSQRLVRSRVPLRPCLRF